MNSTPDAPSRPALRTLTPLEARVLGVLVEKQHTVPDAYPLSVNALTSGCNQKTARAPVMNVTEADVLTTIDDLKRLSLVFEGSSSRVPNGLVQSISEWLSTPAIAARYERHENLARTKAMGSNATSGARGKACG